MGKFDIKTASDLLVGVTCTVAVVSFIVCFIVLIFQPRRCVSVDPLKASLYDLRIESLIALMYVGMATCGYQLICTNDVFNCIAGSFGCSAALSIVFFMIKMFLRSEKYIK